MRTEWIPLSASALVTGVMALVLGTLLNPVGGDASPAETLRVVNQEGTRWLAMAVMYFAGSVAVTLGLPTLLSLFTGRGRTIGVVGVVVFSVGIVGMSGYAMLMVFFKALVDNKAVDGGAIDAVAHDASLSSFLYVWVVGFLLGIFLITIALFRARKTPVWVPILLLVFLVLTPFASDLGPVGPAVQMMAMAAAFTGVATTASSPEHRAELQRSLS